MRTRFKLPKKVKIGALTYNIKYVKPGSKRAKLLGKGELGAVNQVHHLLEIASDISPQFAIMVLVHEILHAIGDTMNPNRTPFAKESFTSTVTEFLIPALVSAGLFPNVGDVKCPRNLDRRKRGK